MPTKAKPAKSKALIKSKGKAQGTAKKRIRKIFGDIHEVVQMPNLIEVQRESYEQFLRSDKETGYVSGLEKTLRSVFPIRDFAGTAELDFVHYELEEPKYDTTECRQRGITYAAPMKVTLRLIVFEVDQETETRSVLDIKEQDVYMGDMPLMTRTARSSSTAQSASSFRRCTVRLACCSITTAERRIPRASCCSQLA